MKLPAQFLNPVIMRRYLSALEISPIFTANQRQPNHTMRCALKTRSGPLKKVEHSIFSQPENHKCTLVQNSPPSSEQMQTLVINVESQPQQKYLQTRRQEQL